MSSSKLLAFRDKDGLRPLCMGKKDGTYFFSSEDCALSAAGAEFVRDLLPGELVAICENKNPQQEGERTFEAVSFVEHSEAKPKTCIYEYMYFARPDSTIDGVSVYSTRLEAGKKLAKNHPVAADLVIGAPSAGLHYALGYALESGLPYGDGLFRNYYFGRRQPRDEKCEQDSLAIKINVIKAAINGKRIVLVDDSMIRGITAKRIIALLKASGAKEVHLRVACPCFVSACPYSAGIHSDLKNKHIKDICNEIGADSLAFLSAKDLTLIGAPKDCCKKCFDNKAD